jgi:hypothetical protein
MRTKINDQPELDFQPSNLQLTNEYYGKYEAVSKVLDESPKILELVHADLKDALRAMECKLKNGRRFRYTSDTALRMVVCHSIEGGSLRGIIVRIDDSNYLRRFVRIYNGPMMDFTTFCRLKNCISPKTEELHLPEDMAACQSCNGEARCRSGAHQRGANTLGYDRGGDPHSLAE